MMYRFRPEFAVWIDGHFTHYGRYFDKVAEGTGLSTNFQADPSAPDYI